MNQIENNEQSVLNQIENCVQKKKRHSFAPGVSGNLNPPGRLPALPDLTRSLRKDLCKKDKAGATKMDSIVSTLVEASLKGSVSASIAIIQLAYLNKTAV